MLMALLVVVQLVAGAIVGSSDAGTNSGGVGAGSSDDTDGCDGPLTCPCSTSIPVCSCTFALIPTSFTIQKIIFFDFLISYLRLKRKTQRT